MAIEQEAIWLRPRVIQMRALLRRVKDARVEAVLREFITDRGAQLSPNHRTWRNNRHEKSPAPKCGAQLPLWSSVRESGAQSTLSLAQVRAPGERCRPLTSQTRHPVISVTFITTNQWQVCQRGAEHRTARTRSSRPRPR